MSKLFLISVIATGCQSRFRNGMQFTDKPKQIEVDDNELAVLESDRHLQVKVLSEGADDVETGDNTVNVDHSASEDTLSDATNASDPAFIIVDELENEPTHNPYADTGTAALPEAPASEAQSAPVPEAPVDHVETITAAMRGLNLDMTADKPTVYDLQALGLDISAKERDAAWNVLTAEYAASNA
ncbi:hypothetical protein [uncultured Psychrobacter sp.]|uniref:hypothetical protein n=1 Tax=uncultured Psychrobacter sp. TaxID=259303 RepID=UPI0026273FC0|nr:hypothetical protein [uncultured Psychrobacter sp.]